MDDERTGGFDPTDPPPEWGADRSDNDAPVHDVFTSLEQIQSGIEMLVEAVERSYSLRGRELRDLVEKATKMCARMDSARLCTLRALDSRPEAVDKHLGERAAGVFLKQRCRVAPGRANADVAAARALDPDGALPRLAEAFAAGEVTREHVDVGVRVLEPGLFSNM